MPLLVPYYLGFRQMRFNASRALAAGAVLAFAFLAQVQPTEAQDFSRVHRGGSRASQILLKDKQHKLIAFPQEAPLIDVPAPPPREPIALLLAKAAIVVMAAVGFIVVLSYRLFSPNGWFNLKQKAEYVPTRYKAHQKRFLRELVQASRQGGLPLGVRAEGMLKALLPVKVALPHDAREDNPHMIVIGGGGKGKTRLIANMIKHDILTRDRAVVVVDSEGGLIDLLAKELTVDTNPDLRKRVILLDPGRRSGQSVAYDPLNCEDQDPQIVANNVVLGFKAIYAEVPGHQQQDQWNAQTANILRNAVMLLMANGRTLADLPTLLSENDFRDILLQTLEQSLHQQPSAYRTVLEAWAQYRRLARTDQWINWVEPILNRVQPVLADVRVRAAITNSEVSINLLTVIRKKKILLVRVPQGHFDPSANLLGSLLITGLRQAAITLAASEDFDHVKRCSVYVDELDKFVDAETFGCISTEHRRYGIGITGTLRTMQTIPDTYRHHILTNAGTICSFAVARKDAELLGPQLFRVDGTKARHRPIQAFFNPMGTSPQFEGVMDEEKLNVDRLIGLDKQEFFCYRVGMPADVLKIRSHKLGTTGSGTIRTAADKNQGKPASDQNGDTDRRPYNYRSKALVVGPISEL